MDNEVCFNCGYSNCYCGLSNSSSKKLSEQIRRLNHWKLPHTKLSIKKRTHIIVQQPSSSVSKIISKPKPRSLSKENKNEKVQQQSVFHTATDICQGFPYIDKYCNQTVYYLKHNTYFVKSDTNDKEFKSILSIDINTQTIKNEYIYPYPSDIDTQKKFIGNVVTILCIDEQNDTLYLNVNRTLVSLNLHSSKWQLNLSLPRYINKTGTAIYIPSPYNQLHVISGSHYLWDKQNKSLIHKMGGMDHGPNFAYDPINKQILLISSWNTEMMIWDIESEKYIHKNGTLGRDLEIKMPNYPNGLPRVDGFCVTVVWDQILFLFNNDWREQFQGIYCLDLLNRDKWFKSKYSFKGKWRPILVNDRDNNAHFMSKKTKYGPDYHYVASMYELLPAEIVQHNEERIKKIIIGFTRQCDGNDNCPTALIKLLSQFYSPFA